MSREDTSLEGIGYEGVTLKADNSGDIVYDATQPYGSAAVGRAVMMSGNRQIRLVGDGQAIYGKLLKVEPDGMCTVQDDGKCHLPAGAGAVITVDSKVVGDLGAGGARGFIRNVDAAVLAEVAAARHIIMDVGDPTRTWVNLD